ncbi:MAG: hypothetical protein D6753_02750 [Planctomycetota bacterium]|nr:MAG: hypothetical protein D6753_02750 [Planctomycetota bacterium]
MSGAKKLRANVVVVRRQMIGNRAPSRDEKLPRPTETDPPQRRSGDCRIASKRVKLIIKSDRGAAGDFPVLLREN